MKNISDSPQRWALNGVEVVFAEDIMAQYDVCRSMVTQWVKKGYITPIIGAAGKKAVRQVFRKADADKIAALR
jgi:predicted site-specific integrase-resolvase